MENVLPMVDIKAQYLRFKPEMDEAVLRVLGEGTYINGPDVGQFAADLAEFLNIPHVIPCGNGTDALQIAFMALGLKPGDEVIVPAFTYAATAEVLGLLGLVPVLVDVDYSTFTIDVEETAAAITSKTKAIVPVHLFGQCAPMEELQCLAEKHGLFVVEDTAQALGTRYWGSLGPRADAPFAGTLGTIGCTSFFPTKNLGCCGDGGALFTKDSKLAERIRMIANHGQKIKYHHKLIGCNSRLDTLQASLLRIKLKHLEDFCAHRNRAGRYYTSRLQAADPHETLFICPGECAASAATYHQYTLKIRGGRRDALKAYLAERGIPTMIYYPIPLQDQAAFAPIARRASGLETASELAKQVLSLPICTEITFHRQDIVIAALADAVRDLC